MGWWIIAALSIHGFILIAAFEAILSNHDNKTLCEKPPQPEKKKSNSRVTTKKQALRRKINKQLITWCLKGAAAAAVVMAMGIVW